MKKRVIVKGIISYIVAILFAIIFGLFLNANVGWFILLTLILAPVLSVFFAWLASRMISVSCQMEDALLAKGDTCSMTICVHNKSIFPTPPVEVQLTNEARVRSEKKDWLVSVMSRATQSFEAIFKAKISGKSMIGIESIRVTDYLGLFSFPVKHINTATLKRMVAVIPDIAEISARDDNLLKVMQTSLHMDDSDDTIEATGYSFGGFPGYDNRDYVPGDPLKRINWKQSAKRNKLLVRLDDEMTSRAVNVVLDSVFQKEAVDCDQLSVFPQYRDLAEDELLPKIEEDAIENALGIMQVLVKHNYTIDFYAMMETQFCKYELADESDLDAVRLELANYSFSEEAVVRIPKEDLTFQEKVGVFSTPNSYEDAYAALEGEADALTTIYSVIQEAKKQNYDEGMISLKDVQTKKAKQEEKHSIAEKVVFTMKSLVVPYLLALLLSISVFSVFDVPIISVWTIAQMIVCAGVMVFCEYVKKHKIVGTLLMIIVVMCILSISFSLSFSRGYLAYMNWFVSGGESVETTISYLMTLLLLFTVFFSMVVYYFTKVLYRTSFLMLISMIPFILHVKVMQEINMVQVILITTLNIAAFLVNSRTQRDKGKQIVGYRNGLVSVGLYAVVFVLIGLAVPKAETKYYYVFENLFLGGNATLELSNEYSGNTDGFNELNNRRLYVIRSVDTPTTLYLKRQTFDLYDFMNDRWYPIDYYSEPTYTQKEWEQESRNKNLSLLVMAMQCAEEYAPGLLAEYGLEGISYDFHVTEELIYVQATNVANAAYLTPPNSIKVTVKRSDNQDQENTYISSAGVFQRIGDFLSKDIEYTVEYYDENTAQKNWIAAGGANFDREASLQMLNRIKDILEDNAETEYAKVVEYYIAEEEYAQRYQAACTENNELIPSRVRELAHEITKNCTYDWEKAEALQAYFERNDFVYDLSYDAPDDSVEYFLFEGKTGTCSDFASAYVLMARSVGLTVRYVEGFVPKAEYNGEYVVTTNCGHAYPEVYLPNVGFVVYEATQPARYGQTSSFGDGMIAYFMSVGFRILVIMALVSGIILVLLFLRMIAVPYVREVYFLKQLKKVEPHRVVVLLYQRIQQKGARELIKNPSAYTPYEYAQKLEQMIGYDISELTYLVERAVYAQQTLGDADKAKAQEVYQGVKEIMKQQKKQKRGK